MPYLIPGFLGVYFHLADFSKKPRAVLIALGVYLALGAFVSLPLGRGGVQLLEDVRGGKEAWHQWYLRFEDVVKCNTETGFEIFPLPPTEPQRSLVAAELQQKLTYLKQNKLNLFAGSP